MFSAVAAVAVFYGAVFVVTAAVVLLIGLVLPLSAMSPVGHIALSGVALTAAGLAVTGLLVGLGWTRWSRVGWHGRTGWVLRGWTLGAGVGVTTAVVALAVAGMAGGARIHVQGSLAAYAGAAAPLAAALVLSALGEELTFRGYPLVRMARAVGKVRASLALAALFATVHVLNPSVTPLGLVNIGLASLVLSAAFFTPGGLPAAWGVHVGWNAGLALTADAPVSGLTFDLPALEFAAGGPAWVTGGAFGPEGGIAASVALGGALAWLARRAAREAPSETAGDGEGGGA